MENENLMDDEESDIVFGGEGLFLHYQRNISRKCNKNEKRSIRRKAERLMDRNGELYYKK